jgi:hypothetical protein
MFPTIMRLVFPLPKDWIINTINFVAHNVYKDTSGISTINLYKIANFNLKLKEDTINKYRFDRGEGGLTFQGDHSHFVDQP